MAKKLRPLLAPPGRAGTRLVGVVAVETPALGVESPTPPFPLSRSDSLPAFERPLCCEAEAAPPGVVADCCWDA